MDALAQQRGGIDAVCRPPKATALWDGIFLLICLDIVIGGLGFGSGAEKYAIRVIIGLVAWFFWLISVFSGKTRQAATGTLFSACLLFCWIAGTSVYNSTDSNGSFAEIFRFGLWLSVLGASCFWVDYTPYFLSFGSWGSLVFVTAGIGALNEIATFHAKNVINVGANGTWLLLSSYPLAMLASGQMVRRVCTGFLCILVVAGVKRGAILAVLSLVVMGTFLGIWMAFRGRLKPSTAFTLVLAAFLCGYGVFAVYSWQKDAIYYRFFESSDQTFSGRTYIYEDLLRRMSRGTWVELILGRGPLSTVEEIGLYAHNDLLQICFDYGLIGGLIFLFFLTKVFLEAARRAVKNDRFAWAYVSGFGVFAIHGLVGGHINYFDMVLTALVLGISTRKITV